MRNVCARACLCVRACGSLWGVRVRACVLCARVRACVRVRVRRLHVLTRASVLSCDCVPVCTCAYVRARAAGPPKAEVLSGTSPGSAAAAAAAAQRDSSVFKVRRGARPRGRRRRGSGKQAAA